MTTKGYAKALYTLFHESPRATLGKEFAAYLERNGKLALLPGIIKALERIERDMVRKKTCHIIAASEHDLSSARKKAEGFTQEEGGDGWSFKETIDPSLIGGYVIRTSQKELNTSDKRGLLELYDRLRSVS